MSLKFTFNDHHNLNGCHAFLGASKSSWLNYDDERLVEVYRNNLAKEMGTRLHALAAELILLKRRQPSSGDTFDKYVNDAIRYDMIPEQVLFYSEHCFGTADSISFKRNFLRIHDLKTGKIPAHMEQLMIYEALFCLEYGIKPGDIKSELRLYQNGDIIVMNPEADDILPIMDKIIHFNKILTNEKYGG